MSEITCSKHFKALMEDAWARKTDDQSLRDNLDTMLHANWRSFTLEEINIARGYIARIDQSILDAAIKQAAMQAAMASRPASRFSHCVRCHASFVAGDLNDPCRIPHVVNEKKADRIADDLYFVSKCCGGAAIASLKLHGSSTAYVNAGPQKNCNEGVHTTNVVAVEFLKRQKPGCNGTNIFPCHFYEGRCVRRAVRYKEGTFVRERDFSL